MLSVLRRHRRCGHRRPPAAWPPDVLATLDKDGVHHVRIRYLRPSRHRRAELAGRLPAGRPRARRPGEARRGGRARELLAGALRGTVAERGPGWLRVSWGPGRDVLARSGSAIPGGGALWGGQPPGVAHVVFAPGQLTVSQLESGEVQVERMSPDEATGIPVWLVADPAPERAR